MQCLEQTAAVSGSIHAIVQCGAECTTDLIQVKGLLAQKDVANGVNVEEESGEGGCS
jgi:hypothetical protein